MHSVIVSVEDFRAAVNHYAALFGRPATLRAHTEDGVEVAFFRLANTMLELRANGDREGVAALRLKADALADVRKHLLERGVESSVEREERIVSTAPSAGGAGGEAEAVIASNRSLRIDPASSRGLALDLVEEVESSMRFESAEVLDAAAGIRALDHVVVLSGAIERTRAFYAEDLGIRLALDKSFEKRGVRLVFFRIGGTTIEIAGRLGIPEDAESQDRFGGLAWQVNEIDAIQARLRDEGFDVSEVREGHKPGTRVCTVRDQTHGVPTLLIEPVR